MRRSGPSVPSVPVVLAGPSSSRSSSAFRSLHLAVPTGVRLPVWQYRWVLWSLGVLAVSGLGWLAVHAWGLWVTPDPDGLPVHTELLHWCIRVHAAAASISLLAIGSLLAGHVLVGWRVRRNLLSGVLNLVGLALLVLTAYMLGYTPEGSWRQAAVWVHWGLGGVLPAVLMVHIVMGRGRRSKRSP